MVKLLSILIIVGGVVLMLANPLLGLFFVAFGVVLILLSRKNAKAPATKETEARNYDIAGLAYHEDDLAEIAQETEEYEYTKKQIINDELEDEKLYKYSFPAYGKLEKDPQNEHDKNAIKVFCGGVHVGFIPANKAVEVGEIMDTKKIRNVFVAIDGGEYRLFDSDSGSITRGKDSYSGIVRIEYEK